MPAGQLALKPASREPLPCKICGGPAALYGVVDFNKSCAEYRGVRLPLSGVPVDYCRCAACGFLFTDVFDGWSDEQFKLHIYNGEYLFVDPDYGEKRPRKCAEMVAALWAQRKAQTRVLDFGGGNDVLCSVLRAKGFRAAQTYDPMVPQHAQPPQGKFDLITCFEAFEHMHDPSAGIAQMVGCLAETGLVLYSTVVQPAGFETCGLDWCYVAPRNGHISIFTRKALSIAWARHGYTNISLTDDLHLAFGKLPPSLGRLQAHADAVARGGAAAWETAVMQPADIVKIFTMQ